MLNFSFRFIILLLCLSFLGVAHAEVDDTTTNDESAVLQININQASSAELADYLFGVGMIKAAAIVEHRAKYGDFHSIDELTAVQGVGEVLVEKNRDKIRVN